MTIIPQISHAMHTLLTTTTETIAAAQHYVKRPDRAKFGARKKVGGMKRDDERQPMGAPMSRMLGISKPRHPRMMLPTSRDATPPALETLDPDFFMLSIMCRQSLHAVHSMRWLITIRVRAHLRSRWAF